MQKLLLKLTVTCLVLGVLITRILILENQKEELTRELDFCNTSLKQANSQILLANKLNDDNAKIIAKYNALKRKEYNNANDIDLDKLHSLDLLLESKSIIQTTNKPLGTDAD